MVLSTFCKNLDPLVSIGAVLWAKNVRKLGQNETFQLWGPIFLKPVHRSWDFHFKWCNRPFSANCENFNPLVSIGPILWAKIGPKLDKNLTLWNFEVRCLINWSIDLEIFILNDAIGHSLPCVKFSSLYFQLGLIYWLK